MNKFTLVSALCGMLGLGAASVQATPYWDKDVVGVTLDAGDSFSGSFDIAAGDGDVWDYAGYDSSIDSLISAFGTITMLDLNQILGEAKISVTLSNSTELFVLVTPEFHFGEIGGQLLLDLSNTGVINYKVTNTGNTSFTLVDTSLNAMSVPDGASTVGLLGLGLVVTAFIGRRKRARRLIA